MNTVSAKSKTSRENTLQENIEVIKKPFHQIPLFSDRDKSYVAEEKALHPFYKYPVALESFPDVIRDKSRDVIPRDLLADVLEEQHKKVSHSQQVQDHIDKIRDENTFTVVTAHQPSLFTGPLYYIFKIISTLQLAEKLNASFPEFHFVPVFITSGEDHDFEEVNHLHLFSKTLTWESGESGSVGMMHTRTLTTVLDQLKDILGSGDNARKIFGIIEKAFSGNERYADAAFELTHELFKDYGLVVLNTHDKKLKKVLAPVIREEIFNQVSHPIVEKTIEQLSQSGFPSQATPREVNFFYLSENSRERIVEEKGSFRVLNTTLHFTREEMEKEIEDHPERFSPNVIIRPIYQEMILPNLAYIGGGGEIAYWLERKAQFEHFGLNFPMLIRRDSAMWIDSGSRKKMEKTGLTVDDLWQDVHSLVKQFLSEHAETEFSLAGEQEEIEKIFKQVAQKAKDIDPSLQKFVLSEHAKARKSLDNIETRLLRAEKQNHDNAVSQIRSVKDKLFPGGGLQERYDNFLPIYLKYGDRFFDLLKAHFDPLEKSFTIFIEQ